MACAQRLELADHAVIAMAALDTRAPGQRMQVEMEGSDPFMLRAVNRGVQARRAGSGQSYWAASGVSPPGDDIARTSLNTRWGKW